MVLERALHMSTGTQMRRLHEAPGRICQGCRSALTSAADTNKREQRGPEPDSSARAGKARSALTDVADTA